MPPSCQGATFDNTAAQVTYNGWRGVFDPQATQGSYRVTNLAKDKVRLRFTGNSVVWFTYRGPDQGIAEVIIDGVSQGMVDLYRANPQWKYKRTFTNLGAGKHFIIVRNTGEKNLNSSDTNMVFDAFRANGTMYWDTSIHVKYNSWKGIEESNALFGTYRRSGSKAASVSLMFEGTSIAWLTARGPNYGKGKILIDGVDLGNLDLYQPNQEWQVPLCFDNLGAGQHRIEVKPLHKKNPASSRHGIVFDAFRGPITVLSR